MPRPLLMRWRSSSRGPSSAELQPLLSLWDLLPALPRCPRGPAALCHALRPCPSLAGCMPDLSSSMVRAVCVSPTSSSRPLPDRLYSSVAPRLVLPPFVASPWPRPTPPAPFAFPHRRPLLRLTCPPYLRRDCCAFNPPRSPPPLSPAVHMVRQSSPAAAHPPACRLLPRHLWLPGYETAGKLPHWPGARLG